MISQTVDGTTPTGPTWFIEQRKRRAAEANQAAYQVVITGTATVLLEGSLDGSNWFTVSTDSASALKLVNVFAFLRVRRSAGTGSADCILDVNVA